LGLSQTWPGDDAPSFQVRFPAPTRLGGLELVAPAGSPFTPWFVSASATGEAGRQSVAAQVTPQPLWQNPHKGAAIAHPSYRIELPDIAATDLMITVKAEPPLAIASVRLVAAHKQTPRLWAPVVADIDADGQLEALVRSASGELVCYGAAGLRWRFDGGREPIGLDAVPAVAGGRHHLYLHGIDGHVDVLDSNGAPVRTHEMRGLHQATGSLYFWYGDLSYSVGTWHTDPQGRLWPVIGHYAFLNFLNADGETLGYSWMPGPWQTHIRRLAQGTAGADDLLVYNPWHGATVVKGLPGTEPSGAIKVEFNAHMPQFRELGEHIRFSFGVAVLFELVSDGAGGHDLVMVNDCAAGMYSLAHRCWRWELVYQAPILAAAFGGDGSVLLGGADGTIVQVSRDGTTRRIFWGDLPVRSLAVLSGDVLRFAVATEEGTLIVQEGGEMTAKDNRPALYVTSLGEGRLLRIAEAGEVALLHC